MKKRKVVVKLRGGLGNQLFEYAAGKRVALEDNRELVLNLCGFAADYYGREFSLDFLTDATLSTDRKFFGPFATLKSKVLKRIPTLYPNLYYYYEPDPHRFAPPAQARERDTLYIHGHFVVCQNFLACREPMRAMFSAVESAPPFAGEEGRALAERPNTVGVHIRWFGVDMPFIELPHGRDYYQRAFKRIAEEVEAPEFYVFSDNPEKSRLFLAEIGLRAHLVSNGRHDPQTSLRELKALSLCRHKIIGSSSTFGWWAAVLGQPPEFDTATGFLSGAPLIIMSDIKTWFGTTQDKALKLANWIDL